MAKWLNMKWLDKLPLVKERSSTPVTLPETKSMTEREAVDAIKQFALAHGYFFQEYLYLPPNDDIAETIDVMGVSDYRGEIDFERNDERFQGFSIWWSKDDTVDALECNVEPPEEIRWLKHIDTVTARQRQGSLLWLGELKNIRRLNLDMWQASLPKSYVIRGNLEFPNVFKSGDSVRELCLYYPKPIFPVGDSYALKVPDGIRNLKGLQRMGIHMETESPPLELPDWLNELPALSLLDLGGCYVRFIPQSVILTGLEFHTERRHTNNGVILTDVTLETGDISVFEQSREFVEAYYRGEVMTAIRECKVIFLGDGAAGKTSLIERITRDSFGEYLRPTDGVKMTKWGVSIEDKPFFLRILDFGGQEIMHSMHRCFLTTHTVYVVVCESRDDAEIDLVAARWLETVRAFAPDCPVILALNKADLNANVSVNERDLKQRNPALKCVLRTSAAVKQNDRYGVHHLLSAILDEIPGCIKNYQASVDMLGVQQELENMTEDYISSQEYQAICARHHIMDSGLQHEMLDRCKNLGIAYYYESEDLNTRLESVRVLNPEWLTNGIYRLILRTPESGFLPHKVIKRTLRFTYRGDILRDKEYTEEEMEFILYVMRKFEISHHIQNGVEMIPLKMSKTPPPSADEFPKKDALHLRWEGTYLPNNLIHRLLIRKFPELDTKCVWRTGGRFRQIGGGCEALAEMNDKALDVYVNGERDCRQYLETFRGVIRNILDGLNLKAEEMICHTVNGREGKVSYQAALSHLYNNKPEIYLANIDAYVSPVLLLKEIYVDVDRELARYRQQLRDAPPLSPEKPPEKAENPLDDEEKQVNIDKARAEIRQINVKVTLTVALAVLIATVAFLRPDLIEQLLGWLFSLPGGL